MPKDSDNAADDLNLAGAAAPASVGAGLREVRERLGWNIADVAEELRIRQPFLEAIERGDMAALPGAAYQTGFVRSYATILGLDPDEILRRFRAEGLGVVKPAKLAFLAPVPDRAVPRGALTLLCLVVAIAAYGLWYSHSAHEAKLAAQVAPVPADLVPLTLPPKLVAPAPTKPEVVPATPAPLDASGVPGASVSPSAAPTAQPPSAQTARPPSAQTASPLGETPPVINTSAANTPAKPALSSSKAILATQAAWVEVRDAQGNILFSQVMKPQQTWPVPELPGLTLSTGNAGGTEIVNNGATGAPLGAEGAVIRGYSLTPAAKSPNTSATAQSAEPQSN